MSEPTPEQKCADLARAMGWKLAHNGYGLSPDYPAVPQPRALPNPYESAADKDALVAWLRSEASSQVFDDEIFATAVCKKLDLTKESFTYRDIMKTFWDAAASSREIIADAAWLAIQVDASPPPA